MVQVELLESQGVPPHQVASHANGMVNFFHHGVALALCWFDANDLVPVEARQACHVEAAVPDTYRWARYLSRRTGKVVAEIAVGKYLTRSRKRITVRGTRGEAILDHDRGELRVVCRDGLTFTRPGVGGDTGYDVLAR